MQWRFELAVFLGKGSRAGEAHTAVAVAVAMKDTEMISFPGGIFGVVAVLSACSMSTSAMTTFGINNFISCDGKKIAQGGFKKARFESLGR